jgi:LuxR family maltose regulon positive regulatory protein
VVQQAEELIDSEIVASLSVNDLQILRGQILLIKAQQAFFTNQATKAIEFCQQVLAIFPTSWTFVRGGAMMYLGMSMQVNGQASEAERMLLEAYESYGNKTDTYALLLLRALFFIYLNTSRLEQVRQIANLLLQGATQGSVVIQKNWGDWVLGVVHYQRNELEPAEKFFGQIIENRYTAQIATWRDAVAGLSLIHQIKGENDEALQMLESISQHDLELSGTEDSRTRSLRAKLMLQQGNLDCAGQWADTFTDLPPDQPLLWFEEPQVTRAQVLLTRGTEPDLQSALQLLDGLDEIADRTHNTRYKIVLLALRALALDTLGEANEASCVLKQGVDLARPGGFVRVFVDLGKPMQKLMGQLALQSDSDTMLNRILVAFPKDDKNLSDKGKPARSRHEASPGITPMAEHLTPRELEVLNLLRGPLSIKEIAHRLNISYATAKRHTINIYSKLGVNQRWNAVDKAISLKILPPG